MNNEEKLCSDFNIYGKFEDMIEYAEKRVDKYLESKQKGDDPGIALCYDVKNYLPKLLIITKKQKEAIDKAIEVLNEPWGFESGNEKIDNITHDKKREVIHILRSGLN